MDERLEQIIREVYRKPGSDILELETMPDHVHLLVDCDPGTASTGSSDSSGQNQQIPPLGIPLTQTPPADAMDEQLPHHNRGGAPLSTVKQYEQNQRNV